MKKIIPLLLIALFSTSYAYSVEIGAKFQYGFFYHPSITLDNADDLPLYSSVASTYDIEPIYWNIKNIEIGPYFSILHVSNSLVYNNIYLRELCGVGVGIDLGYKINADLKINTKIGSGIGNLGESLNKEMYINLLISPSFNIASFEDYRINFDLLLNIIYRKYLLSPSIGFGFTIDMDWISSKNTTYSIPMGVIT